MPALLLGCTSDELEPDESFFKIYDHSNADVDYKPLDFAETIDGFLVIAGTELSTTDFQGVQLIRLDDTGEFVSELTLEGYVVPVGEVNMIDSISYFFAMEPVSLQAVLIGINPQLEVVTETFVNANYPLASSVTDNNELLLLSYNPNDLVSEIGLFDLDGNYQGGNAYSIGPGSDVELEIINHYLGVSEYPLPFFCGQVSGGTYYFNGFYNYSFSLVFTDFSDAPSGVVQGQGSDAGIRAVLPLTGGNFAVAGFQFSDNFQLPETALSTGGISSSVDLYPGDMAELNDYTPTDIITYEDGASTYTVFGAETEGRQIVLYFYDQASGEVAGLKQLGYLYPYKFFALKATEDNSITVLGTTYVAGRYERIALTKMSGKEIRSIVR